MIQDHSSPAFAPDEIPVEFLVLHYTACTLEETIRLFCGPDAKVCAHFVLATDGVIHDLGKFWTGTIRRGAHAGVSAFELGGRKWESFNKFSIGIEIVNFNGNLFPYTDAQYRALAALMKQMLSRFPALKDPNRVVGHEQIAGFRGKADPGLKFDWNRFFETSYPKQPKPTRPCLLQPEDLASFEKTHGKIDPARMGPKDWPELSSKLEKHLSKS
jgi:N-acetyl-anhydromuramyl-L-alanine amidase AmpD